MIPQQIEKALKSVGYMPVFPIEAASKFYEPMAARGAALGDALAHGAVEMNSEWLDFVSRRAREDLALSGKILACRTPSDAMMATAEFMRNAFAAYQGEWARMAEIGSATATRAFKEMAPEAARKSLT